MENGNLKLKDGKNGHKNVEGIIVKYTHKLKTKEDASKISNPFRKHLIKKKT